MLQQILNICEIAVIAVTGFIIRKYVFLEPSLTPKRQRLFYIISAVVIALCYFLFEKDAAELLALTMTGLNTVLGRKKRRLSALLLMIPFPGIINGLLVPALCIPPYLLSFSENDKDVWQLAIYLMIFALLAVFFLIGKKWRRWFDDNARGRTLRLSEKLLLCVIGILMLFFSNEVAAQTAEEYNGSVSSFMMISGIAAFIMTITIIALIMQGNKRAYYHNQVSKMQFNIITMMADIVENRDGNTGGHIKRTAAYVRIIARELKRRNNYSDILTEKYVDDMIVAAPLHDIGKIHISDIILNKPGKLTDDEFDIMKTHTTAGGELLAHAMEELGESSYLKIAYEMALYHHERWDGKGYPQSIQGENIPLCARIMAVADVFDALTAKRCYKSAMSFEKAVGIIREESGTHFDPVVADAFLNVIEKTAPDNMMNFKGL